MPFGRLPLLSLPFLWFMYFSGFDIRWRFRYLRVFFWKKLWWWKTACITWCTDVEDCVNNLSVIKRKRSTGIKRSMAGFSLRRWFRMQSAHFVYSRINSKVRNVWIIQRETCWYLLECGWYLRGLRSHFGFRRIIFFIFWISVILEHRSHWDLYCFSVITNMHAGLSSFWSVCIC